MTAPGQGRHKSERKTVALQQQNFAFSGRVTWRLLTAENEKETVEPVDRAKRQSSRATREWRMDNIDPCLHMRTNRQVGQYFSKGKFVLHPYKSSTTFIRTKLHPLTIPTTAKPARLCCRKRAVAWCTRPRLAIKESIWRMFWQR